jgi:glycosyltransferase involved in cell wall biosynthesis
MRALRQIVRQERPDVIHAWDWWQCLDAYYSVHITAGVPMVVSDMCMSLNRILPTSPLTTFGTPEMVDRARGSGRRRVELLLPPVDVNQNAPDVVSGSLRKQFGIRDHDLLLVTISRFDEWLKGESLRRTIEAVGKLGHELPLRLLLVGDGALRPQLEQLAQGVNTSLKRPAIAFTGALLDPRPAYAAADIVVGMGGSGLRAMAFGKPVIIVGKHGFAAALTPETAESLYYRGIYGIGRGDSDGGRLEGEIRSLVTHPSLLTELGQFARQFVVKHFSLETAGARLSHYCEAAVAEQPSRLVALADGIRTAGVWVRERRFRPGSGAFLAVPRDSATTG